TANDKTITRNDIGSFVNDNFAPNQIIRIQLSDGLTLGDFTVASGPGSVTGSTLTLTTSTGLSAKLLTGASIRKLLDTLTRTDGTSWLDSGFFEGQLVQITGLNDPTPMLEKVDLITGS